MGNKLKVEDILGVLAEEAGFKLKKKDKYMTQQLPPQAPANLEKDYSKMSSDQLDAEIKHVDDMVRKVDAQANRILDDVERFMNKQQPSGHTQPLFQGSRFIRSKVQIADKNKSDLMVLKNYLNHLRDIALEKELTSKFVATHPDLGGIVKKISVREIAMGRSLVVEVGDQDAEKLPETQPGPKSQVTTTDSLPK